MTEKQRFFDNFYLKILLIGWGLGCVIYSFMAFQFWWGNHDWSFLKNGITLDDGFFEARYSQHLPNVLFFEGQVLPLFGSVLSIFFLVLLLLLIARYLDIPKKSIYYLSFIGLLFSLPHTAILFYFVFYTFPLVFWGCFGVLLLFLSENFHKWWKFILGSCGFFLLLGSYPANLGLILTLFVGKRTLNYVYYKENFKEIICKACFFLGQLCVAYISYKCMYVYLEKIGYLNSMMYNLAVRDIRGVLQQVFVEIVFPFIRFSEIFSSLGFTYVVFFYALCVFAVSYILFMARNRVVALLLIVGLLLASRIAFLLSNSAYLATFRVSWWGQVGLISVFLALLVHQNKMWVRNLSFMIIAFFISSFITTDYEIQKVQFLSFKSERLFQKRVEERLFSYSNFNLNEDYVTLSLGYPGFHQRFCYKNCQGFNNEVLDSTILPAEFGSVIFWDEVRNPLVAKYGVWGNQLWFVRDPSLKNRELRDINIDVKDMRYWMYLKAKTYPNTDGIYMGNKFIIFNFDDLFFNRYRETIARNILNFN